MTDTTKRNAALREMLIGRRHQMQGDVQTRMRDARTDRPNEVGDDVERSDADIQDDIEFAMLQMRTETLARIDAALVRLDAGKYGTCFECAAAISKRRLRALPFAVRCQACEERREQLQGRARQLANRRDNFSLFPDTQPVG